MPDSSPAPTSSFRQNATNEPAGAHVGVKSTYAKAAAGTPANATRAANNNAAKPRILIRRKLQLAHNHSVSLDKSQREGRDLAFSEEPARTAGRRVRRRSRRLCARPRGTAGAARRTVGGGRTS